MSFLVLIFLEWTEIAAITDVTLAVATTAAVIVTVLTARAERRHDDARRAEDREWDSSRRKQDREELERRFRAEQRDR